MPQSDDPQVLHERATATGLSGVVRVDVGGEVLLERAYGLADRAHEVAATPEHRFGVASIAKGFTALAVGALVDDGVLDLDAPVRPVLDADLPLVDDAVTVAHLLSHTSGIGDYLDESEDDDPAHYVLTRPAHTLTDTEEYLPMLAPQPQVSAPGERFAYNNSGFVVLALVAQRVSGTPFADLVAQRVFAPAGMTRSGYPRMDEPAGDVATGYLDEGPRTNALHLPVVGSGDGGAVTTVGDLARFWSALTEHRIVSADVLARLVEPVSLVEDEGMRYGRGFWLGLDDDALVLEGCDAGVSARTRHHPGSGTTVTVLANTTSGAWPVIWGED
ncbi:serine hydrolase domain-containing protein [Nocardioides zeae]|uniref:Serine hydrolase domain-containing protein n=1 Tax=Nocardioides imazamoxiresistens TaxID=3231893 RepID=A0ABU3PTU4_9ACTN|nr:serine hydrolase domain-containing protein [Nocardioides zeae]MDT9592659.1 serine hydrolase domain-containing protein [Nocardioides zeae]